MSKWKLVTFYPKYLLENKKMLLNPSKDRIRVRVRIWEWELVLQRDGVSEKYLWEKQRKKMFPLFPGKFCSQENFSQKF